MEAVRPKKSKAKKRSSKPKAKEESKSTDKDAHAVHVDPEGATAAATAVVMTTESRGKEEREQPFMFAEAPAETPTTDTSDPVAEFRTDQVTLEASATEGQGAGDLITFDSVGSKSLPKGTLPEQQPNMEEEEQAMEQDKEPVLQEERLEASKQEIPVLEPLEEPEGELTRSQERPEIFPAEASEAPPTTSCEPSAPVLNIVTSDVTREDYIQTEADQLQSIDLQTAGSLASTQLNIVTNQVAAVAEPSAPALLGLSETTQLAQREEVGVTVPVYPRLDSISAELLEGEEEEELVPFSEEDLATLYPNPQLVANPAFVDSFIMHSNQERHELYNLLMMYLKARLTMATTAAHVQGLQQHYSRYDPLIWKTEMEQITANGRCRDGVKVSHSHSFKVAVFNPEAAIKVNSALKELREVLQEGLCMRSYSSQLARLHVENYLFQLMHTIPELNTLQENSPVTSWIPQVPPGNLEPYTAQLRDCISVLFMFQRKPVRDKQFTEDCRNWLDILLSALLRVATLTDHQFIFNHLLRSPPGVGKWGAMYLQLASPLHTNQLVASQFQNRGPSNYSFPHQTVDDTVVYDWGVGLGLHRDWGGPLLDHFVTMLATLLLPIRQREEFLALLEVPPAERASRLNSTPWTFVDEDLEEDGEENLLLLKEADFISFFDQFPFSDLFQHILQIPGEGDYSVEHTTSYQMLRLIAFCTCLIRLLGAAFSTLRLARYKEFIKQVGRTIRQTVQYVADHWVMYKTHRLQSGDTLVSLPRGEGLGEPRYSLSRLQLEFDQFVLRATQWILTAHKLGAWQFLADMPYSSVSLRAIWRIFWCLYSNQTGPTSTEESVFQTDPTPLESNGCHGNDEGEGERMENERSPSTVEEIMQATKEELCKAQFVDALMQTYTSEAVFLLTTFVNMARSRSADREDERAFIDTIATEIFDCTQVTEFARDAYSRTGCNLLDSIAIVHPFIISTLMEKVEGVVGTVGENCILLFKELPLHLWVPKPRDLNVVHQWLVHCSLSSQENMLARVILSGLNWGTRAESGSSDLVLDWSIHRSVALSLVEAHSQHLPTQPGGRDHIPPPTGFSKVASSLHSSLHRLVMSSEQSEFVEWAWEVVMMLKLHPSQVLIHSMQTLQPTAISFTPLSQGIPTTHHRGPPPEDHLVSASAPPTVTLGAGIQGSTFGQTSQTRQMRTGLNSSQDTRQQSRSPLFPDSDSETPTPTGDDSMKTGSPSSMASPAPTGTPIPSAKDPSVYQQAGPDWRSLTPDSDALILPDLTSASERELAELRDAVKYEGHLAYYVGLCLTSIGADTDHFLLSGLPMLHRLLEQGYFLPALRVLANVTPRFFKHKKILLEEPGFVHVVITIANADSANASLKERLTFSTPVPLVLRKMAALIQMQLQSACAPGGVGGEVVLRFWLDVLLSIPGWLQEKSTLYLLDTLSAAAFTDGTWLKTLQGTLLEAYASLQPLAPRRSSLLSSMMTMIGQEGGPPSIFSTLSCGEYAWLAYSALCAEERYEREEGIWKALLLQLKKDPKASVDVALKKALTELKLAGGIFPSSYLCIYRWAEFCTTLDPTHPLASLVWQHFFMLYLQRPILESSMPERDSQGLRFFSSPRHMSLRRRMKTTLSSGCKNLQSCISELGRGEAGRSASVGDEQTAILRTFLPKCLSFYQMLRLWLEEPRLHDASLYLPGLPPQYNPNRLETIFQPRKSPPWMEFIRVEEVKGQLNTLVGEWMQVAAYQKALPSQTQPLDASPDTAVTRIQKRLRKRAQTTPPPIYHPPSAPFFPLSEEVLLSREALVAVIRADVQYIADQAITFCKKTHAVAELDSEYMDGIPERYSNEPRQCHVKVPCRSKFNRNHQCIVPATIVFRFNEMTVNPKWEQRLKLNRAEYDELVAALSFPVSEDLCRAVMKMEHVVTELSKMSDRRQLGDRSDLALDCGIALFYEILNYITVETRHFPPSCQFLTSCVQILGQEFVQRDSRQAHFILDLLLAQKHRADLLAPLFQPNGCPDQFLHMYGTAAEIAVKEGPSIAFSVLTKFTVSQWLESYNPTVSERSQLLECISQGLTLCGPKPNQECEVLTEVYRHHFRQLVEYQFPDHYNDGLWLLITATDSSNLIPSAWTDFSAAVGLDGHPDDCKLGLHQIQETTKLLSRHYLERRRTSGCSLYSVIVEDYIPLIGQFIHQLCLALGGKWQESVALATAKVEQAITQCWTMLVEVFLPWIGSLQVEAGDQPSHLFPDDERRMLLPCAEGESQVLSQMVGFFVDSVSNACSRLKDPSKVACIMALLWHHYCSSMALPNTPTYIMQTYHTQLVKLPWRRYLPDLSAMDAMMKLKLLEHYPPSSFVFLGKIFPLFDWKAIVDEYCDHGDSTAPVQLHIMLLQLLIMLAAEREVMEDKDTGLPDLMSEAQGFHWEYIEAKTYQDILQWQRSHCDAATVLHTGSSLSLSFRLLKAAAGFPSSSGRRERLHPETWEKRLGYIQVMVELIGRATHQRDTHAQGFSDPLSLLFQTAVDICTYEPQEHGSPQLISLLQEVLNLLNVCSPSDNVLQKLTDNIFLILEQMPDAHLLTLPTVTAGCRTLASLSCMTRVVEHAIECHFKALMQPQSTTLQLPHDINGYGWTGVTTSLIVPEAALNEFRQTCVGDSSALVLNAHLLQLLPLCTSLEQEFEIGIKVVQWCTQMKPKPTQEAKVFLLWEKAISLLLRQVQYGGRFTEVVPHLTVLATTMIRFGEDKASEGILGVIGLGKKSSYSFRFRLISRAMAAFLHCQMPVDTGQSTKLRVVPNAPGHVKDPQIQNKDSKSSSAIVPTKQGDQTYNSLESLLNNKQYSHLREQVSYTISFVNDMKNCVMNSVQLLVYLCNSLYPDCRFLDLLRVL